MTRDLVVGFTFRIAPVRMALVFVSLGVLAAPEGALSAEGSGRAWTEAPFTIEAARAQEGWVARAVEAGRWKPVAQPGLADELKAAPVLKVEEVGPAPRRCWSGHKPYLVPNPGGKSWDMVFPYYNKYRGEQEIVIHDFGSGKTTRQVLSTRKGEDVLTREAIGFHMQPSYYVDGKLVFEHWGVLLWTVYDPAANAFTKGLKPFGDKVINGRCVLAEDGMLYGMGWPRDKSGFVAYRLDPKTLEAKRWPAFGPANPHRTELYRQVRMSGDWLYAAIGNRPWHLVAFNVRTGEGAVLAATEETRGDYKIIRLQHVVGGLRGSIRSAAMMRGIESFDRKSQDFWLHDGRIVQRDGEVPPWSDKPAREDKPTTTFRWARQFQVWPRGFTPPSPPPEIQQDAGDPAPGGRVRLPYRLAGQNQWQALTYTVKMYPGEVWLLREVNDHVLFATDSGYGQHVFYDTKARRLMRVGGTLSPYSSGLFRGRLYVSGYPNSQMYEYDFTRAIGLQQAKPNPRRLEYLGRKNDTHCPLAGTVGLADGRVYSAGTTYGRRRVGGGLGWYDTATGQIGGMPVDEHRFFWMTPAGGGRYLLLSSKREGQGQLWCWDTKTRQFAYKKTILDRWTPGAIVEALPGGLVIGHTTGADKTGGVLYGLRADTGEVLWQKPVPVGPITAYSSVRRHAYSFRRGPEGHIWSFFGPALVRIDPTDARVRIVGRVPGGPAQLAFTANGVYLAGGKALRRIKGVTAKAGGP